MSLFIFTYRRGERKARTDEIRRKYGGYMQQWYLCINHARPFNDLIVDLLISDDTDNTTDKFVYGIKI